MLSGYYILNSTAKNTIKGTLSRVSTIVIPFLIYGFLNYIYFYRDGNLSYQITKDFIVQLLSTTNGIGYHLWFVYAIIGIYIISPFVNFLFKHVEGRNAVIGILTLCAFQAYCIYGPLISYVIPFARPVIYIPDFTWFLFYFVLGGLLRRVRGMVSVRISTSMILAGYLTTMLAFYYSNRTPDLKAAEAGINMILLSSGLLLTFANLNIQFKSSVLSIISKNTYGAYLIHALFLKIFLERMSVGHWESIKPFNSLIAVISAFVTSIVFASICNKLFVDRVTTWVSRMLSR